MSAMRDTMTAMPDALRRILAATSSLDAAVERIRGRRVLLVGTGTSWHAANQGAGLLRLAGVQAWAVQGADAAVGGPFPTSADALLLLTHRGTKRYTTEVLRRAREQDVPTVLISGVANPEVDLDTTVPETSSAFTSSHLGALLRVAQLADRLGAPLGTLAEVPDAVAAELAAGTTGVEPPQRLLELTGVGINAWTASEGALKVRETSYLPACGGGAEQLLHGPSVALRAGDTLVCLDGGGPGADRLDDLIDVVSAQGAAVHRFTRTGLGEALSIFALTVVVQKIAVESAESLGTNPDSFGKDLPGRADAWSRVQL